MDTTRIKRGYLIINEKKYPVFEGVNPVGRSPRAVVKIPNSTVSHQHALVIIVNNKHYVCDMKSCNPTQLNNDTLLPFRLYQLTDLNKITFGKVSATYKMNLCESDSVMNGLSQLDDSLFDVATQPVDSHNNVQTGPQNDIINKINNDSRDKTCQEVKGPEVSTQHASIIENCKSTYDANDHVLETQPIQNVLKQMENVQNDSINVNSNVSGDKACDRAKELESSVIDIHDIPTQRTMGNNQYASIIEICKRVCDVNVHDLETQPIQDDPKQVGTDQIVSMNVNSNDSRDKACDRAKEPEVSVVDAKDVPTQRIMTDTQYASIIETYNDANVHDLETQPIQNVLKQVENDQIKSINMNSIDTEDKAYDRAKEPEVNVINVHNLATQSNTQYASIIESCKSICDVNVHDLETQPIRNTSKQENKSILINTDVHDLPTQLVQDDSADKISSLKNVTSIDNILQEINEDLRNVLDDTWKEDFFERTDDNIHNQQTQPSTPKSIRKPNNVNENKLTKPSTSDKKNTTIGGQNPVGAEYELSETESDSDYEQGEQLSHVDRQVFEETVFNETTIQSNNNEDQNVDDDSNSSVDFLNMQNQGNDLNIDKMTPLTSGGNFPCSLKTHCLKRKVKNVINSNGDSSDETDIELPNFESPQMCSLKTSFLKTRVRNVIDSDNEDEMENLKKSIKKSATKSKADYEDSETDFTDDEIEIPNLKKTAEKDCEDNLSNDSDYIPATQNCLPEVLFKEPAKTSSQNMISQRSEAFSLNLVLVDSLQLSPPEPSLTKKYQGLNKEPTKDIQESSNNSKIFSKETFIQADITIFENDKSDMFAGSANGNGNSISMVVQVDNMNNDKEIINKQSCNTENRHLEENLLIENRETEHDVFLQPTQPMIPTQNKTKELQTDENQHNIQPTQPIIFKQNVIEEMQNDSFEGRQNQGDVFSQPTQPMIEQSAMQEMQKDSTKGHENQDDLFLQPTQLMISEQTKTIELQTDKNQHDIFIQPTQPIILKQNAIEEMQNDSFEGRENQGDVFSQPTQPMIQQSAIQEMQNDSTEGLEGQDDVFLQPTQLMISEQTETIELQTDKNQHDIFIQPTQPIIFKQNAIEEMQNDSFEGRENQGDLFLQPTQLMISEQTKTKELQTDKNQHDISIQPTQPIIFKQNAIEEMQNHSFERRENQSDVFSQPTQPMIEQSAMQEMQKDSTKGHENQDDLFLQPTQLMISEQTKTKELQTDKNQHDIFIQPTQPIILKQNAIEEMQNDSFEGRENQGDVFSQPTQPMIQQSAIQEMQNDSTEGLEGQDDVFLQPTQLMISEQTETIELQTDKNQHDIFIQPTQPIIFKQNAIEEMQNDSFEGRENQGDLFLQPTQLMISEQTKTKELQTDKNQHDISIQPTQPIIFKQNAIEEMQNHSFERRENQSDVFSQPTQPMIEQSAMQEMQKDSTKGHENQDDLFLQPTQLMISEQTKTKELQTDKNQHDISIQPTQPIIFKQNAIEEMQNDSFERRENQGDVFSQPTQLMISEQNNTKEIQNDENRDDVFLQPTQLMISEQNNTKEIQNDENRDDVFLQPTQLTISEPNKTKEIQNDENEEDIFLQPTQLMISEQNKTKEIQNDENQDNIFLQPTQLIISKQNVTEGNENQDDVFLQPTQPVIFEENTVKETQNNYLEGNNNKGFDNVNIHIANNEPLTSKDSVMKNKMDNLTVCNLPVIQVRQDIYEKNIEEAMEELFKSQQCEEDEKLKAGPTIESQLEHMFASQIQEKNEMRQHQILLPAKGHETEQSRETNADVVRVIDDSHNKKSERSHNKDVHTQKSKQIEPKVQDQKIRKTAKKVDDPKDQNKKKRDSSRHTETSKHEKKSKHEEHSDIPHNNEIEKGKAQKQNQDKVLEQSNEKVMEKQNKIPLVLPKKIRKMPVDNNCKESKELKTTLTTCKEREKSHEVKDDRKTQNGKTKDSSEDVEKSGHKHSERKRSRTRSNSPTTANDKKEKNLTKKQLKASDKEKGEIPVIKEKIRTRRNSVESGSESIETKNPSRRSHRTRRNTNSPTTISTNEIVGDTLTHKILSHRLSNNSLEEPNNAFGDTTETAVRKSKRKLTKDVTMEPKLSLIEELPESSEQTEVKRTKKNKLESSPVLKSEEQTPSISRKTRRKHRRQSSVSEDDCAIQISGKKSKLDVSTKGSTYSSDKSEPMLAGSSSLSPERNRRTIKPKVVFTMMDSPELESLIRKLGGSVVDTVESCSVLVTLNVKRSQKLLMAIGLGKPICSSSWLEQCKKQNKFLDPWNHILHDSEAEKKWKFSLEESLRRSKEKKLFDDYFILILVSTAVDALKASIEACGGKSAQRCPPKYKEFSNFAIVSNLENKSKHAKFLKQNPKVSIVTSEAIFDAVLRQEIHFENHLLT